MKNHGILAVALACAALLAGVPDVARAQVAEAAAAAVAGPVISKVVEVIAPKKDPPGTVWLSAQVIHVDFRSMIVQEEANPKMIHTFSYSPEVRDHVGGILNNGGYRYGAKVKILYQQVHPGDFVALKIKGKPS